MGNNLDEPRGPFYTLFILIIIIISSLSLPFRFQSFGSNFAKFLDTNDRIYIFLLCNGILFFLFFDCGSHQAGLEAKKTECNESLYPHDQVEDLERELVAYVQNEHGYAMEVKLIEENGMLVGDDDHDLIEDPTELVHDDDNHDYDLIEDPIELVHDDELQIEVICDVENEEEHDDEDEANDFRQKCEAFIKKVRQNMHCES